MLSDVLVEQMQYFVGRVCTVMTRPMALAVSKKSHQDWFTITVDGVDHEAILGTDLVRGTKHLFFFPIIGIVEEQTISSDHPHYADIKKQMENKLQEQPEIPPPPQTPCSAAPPGNFVQIDQLTNQAQDLKSKWSTRSDEKETPCQEKK